MQWSKDKPTKPGWYWWRMADNDTEIVRLSLYDGELCLNGGYGQLTPVVVLDGEFQGPLEPTDPLGGEAP